MNSADSASSRKLVYHLLICVAAAALAGRILSAERVYEPTLSPAQGTSEGRAFPWPATRPAPTPMFSSNDRSRRATIRALVHDGTYVIGKRDIVSSPLTLLAAQDPYQVVIFAAASNQQPFRDTGIIFEDGYQSVDKVMHPDKRKFYSSKPPLMPTILAGEYWLLRKLGWSIEDHRFLVVRVILLTIHWLPVVIFLILLSRLVERYGTTDWGRYYVLAAGCFATLLPLFSISLNNHTMGTCCVMFALYPILLAAGRGSGRGGEWQSGRVAAWESGSAEQAEPGTLPPSHAATLPLCHTPTLPHSHPLTLSPSHPLTLSPGAALLAGLFSGFAVANELPALAFAAALGLLLLWAAGWRAACYFGLGIAVPLAGFLLTNYLAIGDIKPAYSKFGGPWYEYEGSYWKKPPEGQIKNGIDWAHMKESRVDYAFNLFLGHHGLFSLSPMYLLAMAGMIWGVMRLKKRAPDSPKPTEKDHGEFVSTLPSFLFPITLVLTVVVVGFYLFKSTNYGGWTNGLRWLMWLTPMWLLTMLPVVDRLARSRFGRGLALTLLAISVMSVNFRVWNPWRHPWIYQLLNAFGWEY